MVGGIRWDLTGDPEVRLAAIPSRFPLARHLTIEGNHKSPGTRSGTESDERLGSGEAKTHAGRLEPILTGKGSSRRDRGSGNQRPNKQIAASASTAVHRDGTRRTVQDSRAGQGGGTKRGGWAERRAAGERTRDGERARGEGKRGREWAGEKDGGKAAGEMDGRGTQR